MVADTWDGMMKEKRQRQDRVEGRKNWPGKQLWAFLVIVLVWLLIRDVVNLIGEKRRDTAALQRMLKEGAGLDDPIVNPDTFINFVGDAFHPKCIEVLANNPALFRALDEHILLPGFAEYIGNAASKQEFCERLEIEPAYALEQYAKLQGRNPATATLRTTRQAVPATERRKRTLGDDIRRALRYVSGDTLSKAIALLVVLAIGHWLRNLQRPT